MTPRRRVTGQTTGKETPPTTCHRMASDTPCDETRPQCITAGLTTTLLLAASLAALTAFLNLLRLPAGNRLRYNLD